MPAAPPTFQSLSVTQTLLAPATLTVPSSVPPAALLSSTLGMGLGAATVSHYEPMTLEEVAARDRAIDVQDYQDDSEQKSTLPKDWPVELIFLVLEAESNEVYCICRRGMIDDVAMIACDFCDEWFHLPCIGLTPAMAKRMKRYTCFKCVPPEEETYQSTPPSPPRTCPIVAQFTHSLSCHKEAEEGNRGEKGSCKEGDEKGTCQEATCQENSTSKDQGVGQNSR